MNIYLKEKQIQILANLQKHKELIQLEYSKIVERENEIVTVIVESAGRTIPKEGVKIEGNVIIVPDLIDDHIEDLTAPKTA